MKDTENNNAPRWLKTAGYIVFAIVAGISGYLTLKNDLIPNFGKWLSPVTVTERPKATEGPTIENLLAAVNEERAKAGVAPLAIDERLNRSAQIKADDMKNRSYFGHSDPDGRHGYSIAREHAPDCAAVGENITDSGVAVDNTPQEGIRAWVNSPVHYSLIVDPNFNVTGFGITSTGLVEHFCQL